MKIETIGRQLSAKDFNYNMPRFVAYYKSGEVSIRIAVGPEKHIEIFQKLESLDPGMIFVGGGYCTTHMAKFDSESCRQVLGFDRPKDKNLQKEILEAIKNFIRALP